MKLVGDDFPLGTMRQEAPSEGRPHVHHSMRDLLGPLLAEPAPEGRQVLLFASFHDMKKFRPSRTFRSAGHRPVALPLAGRDLVEPQDIDPVEWTLRLDLLHHRLVDRLHRSPVKPQKKAHRLVRRHLAQLVNKMGQRAGHARTSDRQEFHLFRDHLARRTDDTMWGKRITVGCCHHRR